MNACSTGPVAPGMSTVEVTGLNVLVLGMQRQVRYSPISSSSWTRWHMRGTPRRAPQVLFNIRQTKEIRDKVLSTSLLFIPFLDLKAKCPYNSHPPNAKMAFSSCVIPPGFFFFSSSSSFVFMQVCLERCSFFPQGRLCGDTSENLSYKGLERDSNPLRCFFVSLRERFSHNPVGSPLSSPTKVPLSNKAKIIQDGRASKWKTKQEQQLQQQQKKTKAAVRPS